MAKSGGKMGSNSGAIPKSAAVKGNQKPAGKGFGSGKRAIGAVAGQSKSSKSS